MDVRVREGWDEDEGYGEGEDERYGWDERDGDEGEDEGEDLWVRDGMVRDGMSIREREIEMEM